MDIQKLYRAFGECTEVKTDSRTIKGGEMFFGLKGENFDGNEYALRALEQGAGYAVVDEGSAAAASKDERIIVVEDTLKALQALAKYHRENTFVDGKRLTVIGLTGTNGKTTTKELLTRVLAEKFNVTATRGNLNNDIGVPLSLLKINAETQIAVIEMGASHPGDISVLVDICQPDYGLITNVGKAHLLGFGSYEGVRKAKGELYDHIQKTGGSIFLNVDDPVLAAMAAEREGLRTIAYGINHWGGIVLPSDSAHPFVRMALPEDIADEGKNEYSDNLLGIETHLTGAYNAGNIASALAVGLHFGVALEDALRAVSEYAPVNNRSQLVRTESNILIVDAYNANPTSMAAALDNLDTVEAARRVALLGDMRELGEESLAEHITVVRKLQSMGLDSVCLVGEEFTKAVEAADAADAAFNCFQDSASLALWLKDNPLSGATVLVKGSRGTMMEKVLGSL